MSGRGAPRKPLLRPVLILRKEPAKKEAIGRGKKEEHVVVPRLARQRAKLSEEVSGLISDKTALKTFGGSSLLVAEMFSDSFATSKAPRDLFRAQSRLLLRGPALDGYLVESTAAELKSLRNRISSNESVPVRCDISRVKSIRPYGEIDLYRGRSARDLWDMAPEFDNGRAFLVWLAPFREAPSRTALLAEVRSMSDGKIFIPTTSRMLISQDGATTDVAIPDLATRQNSIAVAQRNYLSQGHARALIEIPSQDAMKTLIASGSVFRIEPVFQIVSTAPGEGEEPSGLPLDIAFQPVVGVFDGGCTARRYKPAEAWREQSYVSPAWADTKHGNQVASVIIHGHEWNNNLPLPELYCRIGVAPVIARADSLSRHNPARLISYLDEVMTRHPETRVWNLSWNERESVDPIFVSALGHELRILSRKHRALFVISTGNVGNTKGDRIAPPADCEAALVVGARQFDENGEATDPCPQSLPGYGPELQLAPHVASYSPLRLLGGRVRKGTSFPTGLISALASHTFENLRDPTPDLVRALVINRTELDEYDPRMGWGTPSNDNMPWNCAPGTVTLAFKASLRAGNYYYWEGIPIPRELIKNGKLHGHVSLTTVHEPLCNAEGGPNYIATRVAAAVQYPNNYGTFVRLVGSKEQDNTEELRARQEEYKWQPLRRECRDFSKRGLSVGGSSFRLYARLYGRNIEQFGYRTNADIPEIETVFVVTFSDGSGSGRLYDSTVTGLGNFVESAVVNQDIEIHS